MGSQHAVAGVLVPELPGTATPAGGPSGWPAVLAGKAMRVLWLWPALLMLAVGCYQLTVPDLWRDELSSWSFASRPVPELMAVVRRSDASQLAYYLLLHYWMAAFGYSVLAMRMLSVLAMTAAAACVTLAARKLAGSGAAAGRAGLLAGLAFVLIPSVSRFAQEARFYAFEVFAAMLATWLLLRALQSLPADRVPRQVFVSVTAAQAGALYPDLCVHPARCLGQAPRVWVVTSGHTATPYREIPGDEIAVLRARYRVIQTARVPGLTITLLQRTQFSRKIPAPRKKTRHF
jgi:hypothetical protein